MQEAGLLGMIVFCAGTSGQTAAADGGGQAQEEVAKRKDRGAAQQSAALPQPRKLRMAPISPNVIAEPYRYFLKDWRPVAHEQNSPFKFACGHCYDPNSADNDFLQPVCHQWLLKCMASSHAVPEAILKLTCDSKDSCALADHTFCHQL